MGRGRVRGDADRRFGGRASVLARAVHIAVAVAHEGIRRRTAGARGQVPCDEPSGARSALDIARRKRRAFAQVQGDTAHFRRRDVRQASAQTPPLSPLRIFGIFRGIAPAADDADRVRTRCLRQALSLCRAAAPRQRGAWRVRQVCLPLHRRRARKDAALPRLRSDGSHSARLGRDARRHGEVL